MDSNRMTAKSLDENPSTHDNANTTNTMSDFEPAELKMVELFAPEDEDGEEIAADIFDAGLS
jgi:hypothetical protein